MTVTCVNFNQDSSKVVFGCSDGSVGLLNLKTKKKDVLSANHKHAVVAVAFNCNDSMLASASDEGTIQIYSHAENTQVKSLHSIPIVNGERITCMKFSMVK